MVRLDIKMFSFTFIFSLYHVQGVVKKICLCYTGDRK